MALTVGKLIDFLGSCSRDDIVVVAATLGDGSVLGVRDLNVGTDQGGANGEGFEVVIGWTPGAEEVTRP